MTLETKIHQFLANPFPLWETTLTHQLVKHQWKELKNKGFASHEHYSTAGVWLNKPSLESNKKTIFHESYLCVEMPSFLLNTFYEEHGLELLSENEIKKSKALPKISKALSILSLIEPVYSCIYDLIQSIHILRQSDEEIDLSYSHPAIPFSIFVSVCHDDSMISSLRVAESILHEAMHLKLTLIENTTPLIQADTGCLYYSPWREEQRPVRGVLHGLFVFKTIADFYNTLLIEKQTSEEEKDYLLSRISQVKNEINQIIDFSKCNGLTKYGASLARGLLPLN